MAPRGYHSSSARRARGRRLQVENDKNNDKDNDKNNDKDNDKNNDKDNDKNNKENDDGDDDDDAADETEPPTSFPTRNPSQAPTRLPTITPTHLPTATLTRAPTRRPTPAPTPSPTLKPTQPPTGMPVPTESPTFTQESSSSFVTSYELHFSLWNPLVSIEEQEPALTEILNVALCSTGAQLITSSWQDACPPTLEHAARRPSDPNLDYQDSSSVVWDEPVAVATWDVLKLGNKEKELQKTDLKDNVIIEKNNTMEYWKWNFTYHVLQQGDQTEEMLQTLLEDSITSGRMQDTLQNFYWPDFGPTKVSLLGSEADMFLEPPSLYGPPIVSGKTLRGIGITMIILTLISSSMLTYMARKHRKRQLEFEEEKVQEFSSNNDPSSSPPMPNHARDNLELILSQSRQMTMEHGYGSTIIPGQQHRQKKQQTDEQRFLDDLKKTKVVGQAPPRPESLLNTSSEKDDEDDEEIEFWSTSQIS